MTRRFRSKLLLAVAGSVALWACADDRQVSTEVENEVAARAIQGVAMDSEALDSSSWSAWDATGSLVAQGMTDSVGYFEGVFSKPPVGGVLVVVTGRSGSLRALVGLDSNVVKAQVATALVNVLTDAAVPATVGDPTGGFPESLASEAPRNGQKLLDSAIGVHLPWSEFAWDPNFKGYGPSRGDDPTPMAGFLRAFAIRGGHGGQSGPRWIDSLVRRQGRTLGADSLFAIDLAGSMSALRLPQSQSTHFVQRLDSASGNGGAWERAWLDQQILPDRQILFARIPWAAFPSNSATWRRVVQVTGDSATAYDRRLSPQARSMVRPGRSHEILAIVVGSMIAPDSTVDSIASRAALDAYLARTVGQAMLLLDQVRPDAWGFEPGSSNGSGGATDSVMQRPPPPDKVALLVSWGLQAMFQPGWNYAMFQRQTDPAGWMASRYRDFSQASEAADTLKNVWGRRPELGLPYPFW